jgi:hypothetical protein
VTDYPFDIQLVVDPANIQNVIIDAIITLYDPADTLATTPLDLKDLQGIGLANPLHSNHLGYLPPFSATLPQVMWRTGSYSGLLESYTGLRDEAVAARLAAEAAARMIVIIGFSEEWPTGLPDGTLVCRVAE